jgi:hypothetical protein
MKIAYSTTINPATTSVSHYAASPIPASKAEDIANKGRHTAERKQMK